MHLFHLVQRFYDESGNYYGSKLEVTPVFKDNRTANVAFYQEVWHRLRRDIIYKTKLTNDDIPFDSILLFSATVAPNGNLCASTMVNNGLPSITNNVQNAKRLLRRADKLAYDFIMSGSHDLTLIEIAKKFETDPKMAAYELKSILKIYCRSKGFFINENDANYAIAASKERRRKAYEEAHPEHTS